MINKSKLYTIKQASDLLDIPCYTLRFWEKKFNGYISPRRTKGGQRRYDEEGIKVIKKIKELIYVKGYTLNGVLNNINQRNKNGKSINY